MYMHIYTYIYIYIRIYIFIYVYIYILINTQLRRLIESTLIKSNPESRRGKARELEI